MFSGVTLPPYNTGAVPVYRSGQKRPSASRMAPTMSATISPVALRPVPMAHTGS